MRPNIGRAIVGGLVATPAMTALIYIAAPMMGVRMDIALMLGTVLGGGWIGGMLLHIFNGAVLFPLLYAFLVYRWLHGPPMLRGVSFGVFLWLLSQTIFMPLMGGGAWSAHLGGAVVVAASLVGHVVYGALLGWVTGAVEPIDATPGICQQQTRQGVRRDCACPHPAEARDR